MSPHSYQTPTPQLNAATLRPLASPFVIFVSFVVNFRPPPSPSPVSCLLFSRFLSPRPRRFLSGVACAVTSASGRFLSGVACAVTSASGRFLSGVACAVTSASGRFLSGVACAVTSASGRFLSGVACEAEPLGAARRSSAKRKAAGRAERERASAISSASAPFVVNFRPPPCSDLLSPVSCLLSPLLPFPRSAPSCSSCPSW